MSSLEQLSLATWNYDTNPLFTTYRLFKTEPSTSRIVTCLGGSIYNAIHAIGQAFASLPRYVWNGITSSSQHNIHWAKSVIYAELTWICLKAIFKFKPTMEQLQELEARLCLANLVALHQANPSAQKLAIHLNGPESSYPADVLVQNFTRLLEQLPNQRQANVLKYLEQKIASLPPGDIQTRIIEFLYKLTQSKGDAAETARPILRGILKSTYESTGRVLVAYADHTLQFVRKETMESGAPLIFTTDQFDPPLATGAKEGYPNGVRFIEKEVLNRTLFENLNKVYVSPNDAWENYHVKLADDIAFLNQIVPGKTADKINKFLTFACAHWVQKILSGTVVKENIIPIITLCNKLEPSRLHTATTLYLLTVIKLSELKPEWREVIKLSKAALMDLMFRPDNKLSPTTAFVQLLTFFLQEGLWKDAEHLCGLVPAHSQRLNPVTPQKFAVLQQEFAEIWKTFPAAEQMKVCLALYKTNPKDTQGKSLFPLLTQAIPAAAREAAIAMRQPTPECDEILAMALLSASPEQEDFKKICFEGLQLVLKKEMPLFLNACVRKIIEQAFHLEKGLSSQNITSFVDALPHYAGPALDMEPAKVFQEGFSILKFANGLSKRKANLKGLCLNYLKSKTCYRDAAVKQESTAEAKELLLLYK